MNQKERDKLYTVRCLIDGKMTVTEAAKVLGLSERQVKRLKKGVREFGDAFVIHKNKGRKPSHAIPEEVKNRVAALKSSDKYARANFSHFQELIGEYESISLSKPSVYRILRAQGFVSPKKHSRAKRHRRRKRKPQRGMLVIVDASPYTWFFDGVEYSLHGAIDDATGEILSLFFMRTECLEGYYRLMEIIIARYGRPLAIYADRHTIFRSPKADKLTLEEELSGKKARDTQFGRAMAELGINLIWAKSPQAKGRIERLWETLQSRLPVVLQIEGIDSAEKANAFLHSFIQRYNERFGVQPLNAESAFRPLPDGVVLEQVLCLKESRQVDHGSCFSYHGTCYRVVCDGKTVPLAPKSKVTVLKSHRLGLKVQVNGAVYEVEALEGVPPKKEKPQKSAPPRQPVKPAEDHPWRAKKVSYSPSFYEESDREILEALFSSRLAWR